MNEIVKILPNFKKFNDYINNGKSNGNETELDNKNGQRKV